MINRRGFIKQTSLTGLALTVLPLSALTVAPDDFEYRSDFYKIVLDGIRPRLKYFSTDSLGKRQFNLSPLLKQQGNDNGIEYQSRKKSNGIEYYTAGAQTPNWEFKFEKKQITLRSQYNGDNVETFPMCFAQQLNHSTVLGIMKKEKEIAFPCVLHLPGMGTFRIYCDKPGLTLGYDAFRFRHSKEKGEPYVNLYFKGADVNNRSITYTMESVAIFPDNAAIKNDARFDGYRRNYINIFQINPVTKVLSNNSASDACSFTLYMYAEMAKHTPGLANGLTAMDMVGRTLDEYINGMKGYGQVGYNQSFSSPWPGKYDSLDTAPSLIMAACYYIQHTHNLTWAKNNYKSIKAWADKLIATDKDGSGLVAYGYSGNSKSWNNAVSHRPSNWWDTIGFGYQDAYANALAYRAFVLLADVAMRIDEQVDGKQFASIALRLRQSYYSTFFNPESGLLAGWKSEDGKLHDYHFVFVNSAAVCYDLLSPEQASRIMKTLLAKMKEAGYDNFKLGLPGNLIPVRAEDYVHHEHRWGYGAKEDGSDGFQIYENGGATGCYAYFTIKALYQTGMKKEAEMILLPMMESYSKGEFEGHCPGSEMTRDWKTWNGECWGYEGFLVDNYLTFLAVLDYTA